MRPAEPMERDRILLSVIDSPDPYGKQIDGMGVQVQCVRTAYGLSSGR